MKFFSNGKRIVAVLGIVVLVLPVVLSCAAPEPTPTPTTAPAPKATPTKAPEPTPTTAPVAKPTPTKPAPKPTPTTKPPAKPKVEEPRYGGILAYPNQADPPSFDIQQEVSVYVLDPVAPMYNGLLQYDPLENEKVVGDLAHKWEVSPDGKVWTFHLHEGVKWHDGKPFTSEDVKYNLERWRSPPTGVKTPKLGPILFGLDKIETPDDYTVKVHFESAKAAFIPYLAIGFAVIQPKHILEEKGQDYLKTNVVGTGPYKYKRYNKGVSMEMVKNPDYFVEGRPYLDGITVYIIPDMSTQFAAFRTKQIHKTATYPTLTATQRWR